MGNDLINGGPGPDTFVFKPGFGNDRITGFDANPSGGQDLIELSGFDITADTFADHVAMRRCRRRYARHHRRRRQPDHPPRRASAMPATVNVDDFRFL